MKRLRDQVEAAVEVRYRDPVDGGGLLLHEHARVIADLILPAHAAMLGHELGNVLVPMGSALHRLADDLEKHGDIHAEEMLVRLAVGLRRLERLYGALRAQAGERMNLNAHDVEVLKSILQNALYDTGCGNPGTPLTREQFLRASGWCDAGQDEAADEVLGVIFDSQDRDLG